MISKELFCKTIADIQEQDRKISEFDHALGKICDSAVVFDADNRIVEYFKGGECFEYYIQLSSQNRQLQCQP